MLIAFEGPHHESNTISANRLGGGQSIPKAVPKVYEEARAVMAENKGIVQCFDGIGWLSALACTMVGHEAGYNVSEPHQMFVMPDTHLVFALSRHNNPGDSPLNRVYTNLAHTFMALNERQAYTLFRTVTIVEYFTDPISQAQRMGVAEFSSPLQSTWRPSIQARLVEDALGLFDLLAVEDVRL